MRLVTFVGEKENRLGALHTINGEDLVFDLNKLDPSLPSEMIEFLLGGAVALQQAESALSSTSKEEGVNFGSVKLRAPIPHPGKIICVGSNYLDHIIETDSEVPDYPAIFSKYSNAVIGSGQAIQLSGASDQVDYEAELAFAIGTRARHVTEERAMDYVAGYFALNDVSARDYQFFTSQWTIGKTFDTFAPMGPALVTRDSVPNPHDLNIRLLIGDEVMQDSNTSNLIFKIPYLVTFLSEVMTLEPGDVVTTGTPPGVGIARDPARFLRSGDVVRIEIEGLGVLENPVISGR